MVFLVATEHSPGPAPFDFHFVLREKTTAELRFFQEGGKSLALAERVELGDQKGVLRGEQIDLHAFGDTWCNRVCDERLRSFPSRSMAEGEYSFDVADAQTYEAGEFQAGGHKFTRATLTVSLVARVVRPAVVSDFEVASRGRVIALAPVAMGDGTLELQFVPVPQENAV